MTRKRHGLIAICVAVTVLPAAVTGFGLVSADTSAGQTPCGGPNPTPTPGVTPTPVPLCKPTLTKAFAPDTVQVGDSSTLTFTVTNPNPNTGLSGISFSDTLPAGVEIVSAGTNTCGGTLTAAAGTTEITLSGGTVAADGTCTITVVVTPTTSGVLVNTTSGISANGIGGPGDPASATLTATPAYALGALVTDLTVTGQTVFFSMRATAPVSARLDRRLAGRRAGARCLATRNARRSARACTRYKHVRTIRTRAKRGRNHLKLRHLRKGRYRLTIHAIARADRGLATKRNFTVR